MGRVVWEGRIDVEDCGRRAEKPWAKTGPLPEAALGGNLVDLDPVGAFRAEVEEANFLPACVLEGMQVVEKES